MWIKKKPKVAELLYLLYIYCSTIPYFYSLTPFYFIWITNCKLHACNSLYIYRMIYESYETNWHAEAASL